MDYVRDNLIFPRPQESRCNFIMNENEFHFWRLSPSFENQLDYVGYYTLAAYCSGYPSSSYLVSFTQRILSSETVILMHDTATSFSRGLIHLLERRNFAGICHGIHDSILPEGTVVDSCKETGALWQEFVYENQSILKFKQLQEMFPKVETLSARQHFDPILN